MADKKAATAAAQTQSDKPKKNDGAKKVSFFGKVKNFFKGIGKYFKEEYNADFVFVTHYPSKKRPFYAMDDPEDTRYTLSFDLLYHGLEITTGGQRIHDLSMLEEKIQEKGMTEEGLEQYLDAFRFGMPPHGGLGIGLDPKS